MCSESFEHCLPDMAKLMNTSCSHLSQRLQPAEHEWPCLAEHKHDGIETQLEVVRSYLVEADGVGIHVVDALY